ncbi:MAG TPA: NAD+ synthase [Gammaproteobacteria bacterium]|nr:NAD+ synthase [Gammaproteobacteria bacterium]
MAKKLRVVIAQLNLTVGDIQGNLAKLIHAAKSARDTLFAEVIVFSELSITGYPPEDLLFRKDFIEEANHALNTFKSEVDGIYCVIGHPYATSQGLFNSCSVIYNNTIIGRYAKQHLPNYGVFDECRYFIPGNSTCIVPIHGIPVGIVICEDVWFASPTQQIANQGARIILTPNASPFEVDKHEQRHLTLAKRAKAANIPIIYTNCVGGQDDLIFDGGSMVIDQSGKISQHAGFFQETLLPVDIEISSTATVMTPSIFTLPNEEQRVYDALVLGVRDYIQKNHFPGVLVGVSGGIDSALTLSIAVDALGKDKVHALMMPSRYTADISREDGLALIQNLGVTYDTVSIEPVFKSFLENLAPIFAGKKTDITEENIQARCRGMILMAISNKTGKLVLTTGNRSEMAVGYATLYGDMAGGFAVLKDVPKTWVNRLAQLRNQISPVIPERTLTRPPTAELAPNQKDEDSLPPYEILDKILELYLNQEQSIENIVEQGFDRDVVIKITNLIQRNEYKRRQAAIGVRINHKAFGRERRYPVTNGFKG